jgi:hypothetical protein
MIFDIYLTTFKLAGYNSKCFKENIRFLLLNHTTVMEIVLKMVFGFIRLVYVVLLNLRDFGSEPVPIHKYLYKNSKHCKFTDGYTGCL